MNARVYAAVMARADGVCECGCGQSFGSTIFDRATCDHFFSRAKAPEDEAHCWALRADHHRAKTDSEPTVSFWLKRFLVHAEKHNFRAAYDRAFRRLQYVEQRSAFGRSA
jgi:hypothetical protein